MKQNMRVVGHAIDSNRGHFLIAADAGQIRPELRLHIFGYGGLTIFGAENEMDVIFDERVRHGCAALSGLRLYISLSHRLPVSIQPRTASGLPRRFRPNQMREASHYLRERLITSDEAEGWSPRLRKPGLTRLRV